MTANRDVANFTLIFFFSVTDWSARDKPRKVKILILERLPLDNYKLLKYVFQFLWKVCAYSPIMTACPLSPFQIDHDLGLFFINKVVWPEIYRLKSLILTQKSNLISVLNCNLCNFWLPNFNLLRSINTLTSSQISHTCLLKAAK